ncbi:MAG TPA: hypothetical protein VHB79_05540 [Polyangiaceae bacterium]|nr:hypothetical protein [Polyangiaceae bacterium]
MAASLTAAEEWLRPLDRARTALFVRALRVAPLRAVLVEKKRRVPALLLVHASAALVLAVLAPSLLLVAGPLLLGVPHLLSDVRYLVLRPSLPRRARAWLLGGVALLLLLRIAELFGAASLLRYELPLCALWVTGSAALGARRLRDPRLLVIAALAVTFVGIALIAPSTLRLVMAHAHNVIAVAIWALAFCAARGRALAVSAALGGAVLVLLATPLAWLGFKHGLVQCFGLHSFRAAEQLAPFVRSTPLALGVVASFAFLQSVHYAIWLHAIPQEATRGEGTLSFRMSGRALQSELGRWGALLVLLVVVAVPVLGLVSPLRTQSVYLSLATFHGYLELGALSLWWLNRRTA